MSKNREEYEELLKELNSSLTEDEIIENITKIVKTFSVHFYKDDLVQNPYYKSLLSEIKSEVLGDLYEIKNAIINEMYLIGERIKEGEDVDRLIQLKVECQLLLLEINIKIEETKTI